MAAPRRLAVGSGQAASTLAVLNLCQAGDNFVSSTDLYGGTWNLFVNTFKGMGVDVRFVDPADPQAFARATDERTRCYYAETLPNPKLHVFPIREVAEIGRERGVPLIVDNTAAPMLCRPFDHGAAVVMYSTTKYIGGHGTSIGGLIIDGGTFDWAAHAERFPTLCRPDPSYHGAIWTEAAKPLGPIAYILRARVVLLRDIGAAMSPFNAFMFLQGLETLPLRMRAHCANAIAVANALAAHPKVTQGDLPGPAGRRDAPARRDLSRAAASAPSSASSWPTAGRPVAASSTRSSSSIMSPTSAMRGPWPSIRPRPPTRSSRRKTGCRPGCPRAMSGCRSASSTSTTFSPI